MKDYNFLERWSETYTLIQYHKYIEIYDKKEHDLFPPLKFIGLLMWNLKQCGYFTCARNLALKSRYYNCE